MSLRFNEKKATQAAAFLLRLRGDTMHYLKLIKLLYLGDREALLRWGRPITTDRYFSMNNGPVLSKVLELVTAGESPESPRIWEFAIQSVADYSVRLVADPGSDELSEAEMDLLRDTFEKFGRMNRWKLVDFVHTLPEWKHPDGGAIPIRYRDILNAENIPQDQIKAIESELGELGRVDALLA